MKKFKCFSKSDTNQEAIAVAEADNLQAAQHYFAAQKKLPIEDFLRIFSISKIEQ
jgi:hypothetical protein